MTKTELGLAADILVEIGAVRQRYEDACDDRDRLREQLATVTAALEQAAAALEQAAAALERQCKCTNGDGFCCRAQIAAIKARAALGATRKEIPSAHSRQRDV